jgi:hypothetical protein
MPRHHPWIWVYGLWLMAYGLWLMAYGLQFMVYGLRFTVYGLWFTVYGLWFMVYGLRACLNTQSFKLQQIKHSSLRGVFEYTKLATNQTPQPQEAT